MEVVFLSEQLAPINFGTNYLAMSPILGMPQLYVGNQGHPHNWDVASCFRKYNCDINLIKTLGFQLKFVTGTSRLPRANIL